MELILLDEYCHLNSLETNGTSLLISLSGRFPQEDEEKIISYLESGYSFIATMTLYRDYLDISQSSDHLHIVPAGYSTDGTWVWPDSLTYYVKNHHLRIPRVFKDQMIANQWMIPTEATRISSYFITSPRKVVSPDGKLIV